MAEEDQIKQRNEQIGRSMSRAGIGKVYHSLSLKDFGDQGATVANLLIDPAFKGSVLTGHGFSIECLDQKNFTFPFALAKALRLLHIDVRVMRLLTLLDYIQHGHNEEERMDSRFEDFEAADGIVIPRFYETMDEKPLTRKELYRIENYLSERMDDGFSVSVQYSGDLKKQDWFSDYFMTRLMAANTKVVL